MDYMCISLTLSHLGAHQLSGLLLLFFFLPLILPLFLVFFFLFLFYVYERSACICVCACVQYWWRPEGRCRLLLEPRCCEPTSRFWELNPSLLEKQPALLSVESSLLPLVPSSRTPSFRGAKTCLYSLEDICSRNTIFSI